MIRMRPMLYLCALLSATPAWALCAFQTSSDELSRQLDAAESAYESADVEGFTGAMDEASMALPCLTDTLTPFLAARLHRIQGVRMFGEGNNVHAREALRAARRVDPDALLSTDLVPEGHPIREMFATAAKADLATEAVPVPATGTVLLDGLGDVGRPVAQAVIVQLTDAAGKPV